MILGSEKVPLLIRKAYLNVMADDPSELDEEGEAGDGLRKIIHVESIPVLGTGKTDYGNVQKTVEALVAEAFKPAAEPAE